MNTIYLLSSCGDLTVEKFHFCTWDVRDENTFVEVGICIIIQVIHLITSITTWPYLS